MNIPAERIKRYIEKTKLQKRQSRKESRATLVNLRRNICVEEEKPEPRVLSEAEKLKNWRIEKKKRMEQEKLKRRPPFHTYINVKHTGTSPFAKPQAPLYLDRIKNNNVTGFSGMRLRIGANVTKLAVESVQDQRAKIISKKQEPAAKVVIKKADVTNLIKRKPESTTTTLMKTNQRTIIKQTLKPANNFNKLETTRVTRQTSRNTTIKPAEVDPKPKPTRFGQTLKVNDNSRTTKKIEKEVKSVNRQALVKKELNNKTGKDKKVGKENIPSRTKVAVVNIPSTSGNSKHFTRSRKKMESGEGCPRSQKDPQNGPTFQRNRLEEETSKLLKLKDNWLKRAKEEPIPPEHIIDEILSVTGLTNLLLTSKFEQFKSLIRDCESQLANPSQQQKIVPDDLDGFWEMMYIQVVQLHNSYSKLDRLMLNRWVDPIVTVKTKVKKTTNKTSLAKNKVPSRFKEFLKTRSDVNGAKEERRNGTSLDELVRNEDGTVEDPLNLDSLKNCLPTPKAVKNLLTARHSRRSSLNIIMTMSGLGKFDISGTAVNTTPNKIAPAEEIGTE